MIKAIEFTGVLSGDGEDFCWDVAPEEFEKATGKKPDSTDFPFKALLDTGGKWTGEFVPTSGLCHLYPGDIFGHIHVKPFKFKIEMMEDEK